MKTEKMTATTTATPATLTAFESLLEDFANLYPVPGRPVLPKKEETDLNRRYNLKLFELSTACAKSVVKKCNDPTRHNSRPTDSDPTPTTTATGEVVKKYSPGDRATAVNSGFSPYLTEVYRQLVRIGKAYDTMTDADPGLYLEDLYLTESVSSSIDGMEFIQVATLAILEECKKQLARGDSSIDLTRPYEKRQLKKRVYIQKFDSKNGFETVKTSPIVEVYRAVRRFILSEKSVKVDPENGYTYIEDIVYTDSDSDPATVYRRLPKYADLTGRPTDSDPDNLPGQPENVLTRSTGSQGDKQAVEDFDSIVERLNLTGRQLEVFTLRLKGYGHKAISTYYGVSATATYKTFKQIQKKAVAIGLSPATDPDSDPTPTPTPGDSLPTRKKYLARFKTVDYTPTPTPTPTNQSAFGLTMRNRVIDGRLCGSDGEKVDSWL